MRIITCALMLALLSGCGTPGYKKLEWAVMSAEQAEAECAADLQKTATLQMATCMKAKGWEAP